MPQSQIRLQYNMCLLLLLLFSLVSWSSCCTMESSELDCSSQQLVSLPANASSSITRLRLTSNAIAELDVSQISLWPQLRKLDVSHNLVHVLNGFEHINKPQNLLYSLDLSHNRLQVLHAKLVLVFPALRTLNLSHNALHTLRDDALRLPLLETLDLGHNRLQEISLDQMLQQMPKLNELDVSSNSLWRLDSLSFLPISKELELLDLSYNELRHVEMHALLHLNVSHLDLSHNCLKSMQFLQYLSHLQTLILDDNPFWDLRANALANVQVEFVSLSFMPNLRVIRKNAFSNLRLLRTLSISNNFNLGFVHRDAIINAPSLLALDLSNDALKVLEEDLVRNLDQERFELGIEGNRLICHSVNIWLEKYGEFAKNCVQNSWQNGPFIADLFDNELSVEVGDEVALLCLAVGAEKTFWRDNDDEVVDKMCDDDNEEDVKNRACVSKEQELHIRFVMARDQGTYFCTAQKNNNEEEYNELGAVRIVSRNVSIQVKNKFAFPVNCLSQGKQMCLKPGVRVFALSVDADSVVIGWHMDSGLKPHLHLLLRVLLQIDQTEVEVRRARPIDIGQIVHSFAVHDLNSSSTYVFELCAQRLDFAQTLARVRVETESESQDLQQIDYVALIVVFCLLSFVTGSCVLVLGLRVCQVIAEGDAIFEQEDKLVLAASFSDHSNCSSNNKNSSNEYGLVVSVSEMSRLMDCEVASPIDEHHGPNDNAFGNVNTSGFGNVNTGGFGSNASGANHAALSNVHKSIRP